MLNRSLASTLLITFSLAGATAQADVIAHYRFENGAAGASATQTNSILDSVNGLHMSPLAGPVYRSVSNPGSSLGLEFAGSQTLADRPDSPLFNTNSLTIEAFVRADRLDSLRQIVFRGNSLGGRDPFYLGVLNGNLIFNISDGSADVQVQSSNALPTGQYIHVAGTLDDADGAMKVYVNGELVGSGSAGTRRPNVSLPGARVSIGGLSDGFSRAQYFDGVIDEVRISNTALTPSQFLNVPEPASLTLLACAGLAAGRRRRSVA